jgi:hypothetical protein
MAGKRRVSVDSGKPVVAQPDFGQDVPTAATDRLPDDPSLCSCARLDREEWHEVESDWTDVTFVSTTLNAAMGVPLGYQGVRDKLEAAAAALGATVPEDAMMLIGEGKFRRPVMLEVDGPREGAKGVERPGGVVYSRIVPASLGEMKRVVKETNEIAAARFGRKPDTNWLWYLTCRICSGPREFETLILAHYKHPS